jgi:hypothetical protein
LRQPIELWCSLEWQNTRRGYSAIIGQFWPSAEWFLVLSPLAVPKSEPSPVVAIAPVTSGCRNTPQNGPDPPPNAARDLRIRMPPCTWPVITFLHPHRPRPAPPVPIPNADILLNTSLLRRSYAVVWRDNDYGYDTTVLRIQTWRGPATGTYKAPPVSPAWTALASRSCAINDAPCETNTPAHKVLNDISNNQNAIYGHRGGPCYWQDE